VGVDAWRVGEFTMMCVVVDVVLLADAVVRRAKVHTRLTLIRSLFRAALNT
jgi:hypothetical protein